MSRSQFILSEEARRHGREGHIGQGFPTTGEQNEIRSWRRRILRCDAIGERRGRSTWHVEEQVGRNDLHPESYEGFGKRLFQTDR
ncbi:hypothetical protein KV697_13610 [Sphingomonas sanguinis]|uniref:hypothetical protein n=1 Tax=Sphingomonas sanguinis TaxID=33051 RepID=UPI001C57605B|nr:hypothetical protein [Sphingomonas sanguinis]QXT34816.1 hypothetical protein KV697_13610 [Sphingomonas sanguinis]